MVYKIIIGSFNVISSFVTILLPSYMDHELVMYVILLISCNRGLNVLLKFSISVSLVIDKDRDFKTCTKKNVKVQSVHIIYSIFSVGSVFLWQLFPEPDGHCRGPASSTQRPRSKNAMIISQGSNWADICFQAKFQVISKYKA